MINAICKLDSKLSAEIENILFEIAPSNWSITKNRKTKISTLSGNFNNTVEAQEACLDLKSFISKEIDFIFVELSESSWKTPTGFISKSGDINILHSSLSGKKKP